MFSSFLIGIHLHICLLFRSDLDLVFSSRINRRYNLEDYVFIQYVARNLLTKSRLQIFTVHIYNTLSSNLTKFTMLTLSIKKTYQ